MILWLFVLPCIGKFRALLGRRPLAFKCVAVKATLDCIQKGKINPSSDAEPFDLIEQRPTCADT